MDYSKKSITKLVDSPKKPRRWNEVKLNLEQNDMFHIEFDLPTPRPHFIILFNSIKKNSIKDLDENESRSMLKLVAQFRKNTNNNLGDMILSFHTGSWATTRYFHAHICVDIDAYLNFVKSTSFEKVMFQPTRKWLIKGQENQPFKDLYIENVKNSKKVIRNDANAYKQEEINLIRTTPRNLIDLSYLSVSSAKFEIYFSIKEPTLKFILKNKTSDSNNNEVDQSLEDKYYELLQIMIEFALKYEFFTKPNGCHICLNIREDDATTATNQVEGFIKMSGDKFYDMHPVSEIFLQCFEKNENYTTIS